MAGSITSEGVRNVFPARIEGHAPSRAPPAPARQRPRADRPVPQPPRGSRVLVEIRADDILLARGRRGLSARNQIPGTVERIVSHGPEAEAVVRTGGLAWIVSLVAPAVEQLRPEPGARST